VLIHHREHVTLHEDYQYDDQEGNDFTDAAKYRRRSSAEWAALEGTIRCRAEQDSKTTDRAQWLRRSKQRW
jgi:hypothetical protein